jgi:ATP-dependent helicase/DNAse subunit B
LKRVASRYREHWHEFRKPWREKKVVPAPSRFEAHFGVPAEETAEALEISVGGIDVRIGGCIDRVDVTELEGTIGFWVIDYKTGRAANYQASQVERFEKLQLPLYALAVERVLLKDRPSRPLGLAYWLVTDSGPKGAQRGCYPRESVRRFRGCPTRGNGSSFARNWSHGCQCW